MRFLFGLIVPVLFAATGVAQNPSRLQQLQKVYLMPMGAGLDQYLAERLTSAKLFEVVTDPQKAEAVIADSVGEGIQQRMDELYPPPQAVKKSKDEQDPFGKPAHRVGGFSKGRGTVFIVDRNTRAVLWSIYRPVKGTTPKETNKRAGDIVKRLEREIRGEKKQ